MAVASVVQPAWWQNRFRGWIDHHRTLPRPWELFGQAIKDYRANWRLLVGIILIVTIPVAVLSNFGISSGGNTTTSAYLAFAQLAMNAALVYAVIEILHGRKVGLRQAYYQGSAALVRLILVAAVMVVLGLLLLIGVAILGFGLAVPASGEGLPIGEQVLLAALAVIVSIPSIVLLIRAMWAVFIIFETPLGPIEAVKRSRQLSRGRVVVTLSRLLALLALLLAVTILPVVGLLVLAAVTHTAAFVVLLQILLSLIVLPLSNLYLFRFYQRLA